MPENWEIQWEDYYEILQIHPLAEPEIIKAAYQKLAQKYHPDVNKDPSASERMKKINMAYEILSSPEKRKQYDFEWFRKGSVTGKSALPKSKPVVNPDYISFKDVEPGEIRTASFIVQNAGGPYAKIWVSNPGSWVKVVGYTSLTNSDELPLQVEIEVEGDSWNKNYSETIRVRLDEEETHVKVELQTKPAPTGYIYNPPSSTPITSNKGKPKWVKWALVLVIFGLIIGIISQFGSPDSSPGTTSPASSPILTIKFIDIGNQQIEESLKNWAAKNVPPGEYLCSYRQFTNEDWVWVSIGSFYQQQWGCILYSPDGGNSWEIKWKNEKTSIQLIQPLNEIGSEAILGIDDSQTFIKTSDGGQTWNEFLTLKNIGGSWGVFSVTNRGKTINVGFVPNGGHEVIAVIRTNDWGKTWEYADDDSSQDDGSLRWVLRTYDGGKTWQKIDTRHK